MNPNNNGLDQYRRTVGQVEPPPEPEPNDAEEPSEEPSGDQEVTDNEDPAQ